MKIILLGLSGAGKSTIIKSLRHRLELIQIDDYRRKYGDYTWNGFNRSNEKFIEDIKEDNTNQIIECVGKGVLGRLLVSKLLKVQDTIKVFIIQAHHDVCVNRKKGKNWHDLKLPIKYQIELSDSEEDTLFCATIKRHFCLFYPTVLKNNDDVDYNIALNHIQKFL